MTGAVHIDRETVEQLKGLQGLFHVKEPVVGVRNLRAGGCWIPTIESTREHPKVRLAGKGEAQRGEGRNWAIAWESDWRYLRQHDTGVRNGWLVRDDSVVPQDMLRGAPDPGGDNPNAVLEADEKLILSLDDDEFARRISDINSLVVLERLAQRADALKRTGDLKVYPKADALSERLTFLQALDAGMPREMADPEITMSRMQRLAEEQEIDLSREAQRSRSQMVREICSHYLTEE